MVKGVPWAYSASTVNELGLVIFLFKGAMQLKFCGPQDKAGAPGMGQFWLMQKTYGW
jgi:hypothetical protein